MVRDMLGLADRGRVLDLFEKVMGGKIAEALTDLSNLYDHGADPLAVMQDLLEIVHFLTRVKVAPGAEGFFDGSSGEAKRAAEMAGKLSVPSLTRAWQMLLKGLIEVRDATRPVAACEMALIRLAYAADLPPTDKLVRDLMDGGRARAEITGRAGAGSRTCRVRSADGLGDERSARTGTDDVGRSAHDDPFPRRDRGAGAGERRAGFEGAYRERHPSCPSGTRQDRISAQRRARRARWPVISRRN